MTATATAETNPTAVVIGIDLAQTSDYTAIVVSEITATDPNRYLTRTIVRWRPGRYQQVVERVARMIPTLRAGVHVLQRNQRNYDYVRPQVTVVVDRSGVGRAVADMFLEAKLDCRLELVTITGGHQINRDDDGGWLVPKKDLMDTALVVMQNDRLKIVEQLDHASTLKAEMQNFRRRYSPTGRETFAAGEDWRREGQHDDLVLGQALSLWWGERRQTQSLVPGFNYAAGFAGRGGFA